MIRLRFSIGKHQVKLKTIRLAKGTYMDFGRSKVKYFYFYGPKRPVFAILQLARFQPLFQTASHMG